MPSIRNLAVAVLIISVGLSRPSDAQTIEQIEAEPALKDVYARHFTIGAFLSYPHIGLPGDPPVPGQGNVVSPTGGYLVRHHMNFMGPGNNMKAQNTVSISASASAWNAATSQSERDSINVHPVVRFNPNMIAQLNWAQRHGFSFRAHTLVWHNQTPGTAFFREGYSDSGERLSPELMTERMSNYIYEVFRLLHEGWPGMVTAVDVVNEKIMWEGTDRVESNEWYTTFGDMSYVAEAFRLAREHSVALGETQMKLYYNDYNTHSSSKANGIVRLLTPIWEAGHLDGIGMQQHDSRTGPSASAWITTYNKFAAIASELAVTEFDISPLANPDQITDRVLEEQANQYAMFFKLFMERSAGSGRGKIVNVTKDGLNDQYAFVQNASLWDVDNMAKPAFHAVVTVGRYFDRLDSLLEVARGLEPDDYSPDSWIAFYRVYDDAFDDFTRNYAYFESAADDLRDAYYDLADAFNVLDASVSVEHLDFAGTFSVESAYPNPTARNARIRFNLRDAGDVSIEVFDVLGRQTARPAAGHYAAGSHDFVIDVAGWASGTYFIRVRNGGSQASQTLVVAQR
jgi:GH35 family endo-1,4-beta-xylanase